MRFTGKVQFRSSIRPGIGPPGEAEVLALNPERATRILAATGWDRLEPGSLNLGVENSVVEALLNMKPSLVESSASVRYPAPYQHIPASKRAYHYYRAVADIRSMTQDVLVRRALMNPVSGRVELFAPVRLKQQFGLAAGDSVTVQLCDTS